MFLFSSKKKHTMASVMVKFTTAPCLCELMTWVDTFLKIHSSMRLDFPPILFFATFPFSKMYTLYIVYSHAWQSQAAHSQTKSFMLNHPLMRNSPEETPKKSDLPILKQFVSLLARDQQDDSILQPPLLLYSMFSRDRFLNYTILYNI